MAIFKSSYNSMKIISLQIAMEKIINDYITLFLFNILKLLCHQFPIVFVPLSFFLHQRLY